MHVELFREMGQPLRVRLMLGHVADVLDDRSDEGVEVSVLVEANDNPRLLEVEILAVERAQEILSEHVAALRRAASVQNQDS